MDKSELEKRTKAFAVRVIRFVADLPKTQVANVLGYQLLRAATSVGANYREANRAESRADFIHKIGLVEKEASECRYWLELLDETPHGDVTERRALLQESGELLAIFTAIGRSTKSNSRIAKSEMRNPQSAIPNPKSPIRNSQSEIRIPKSQIRNPK